MFCFVRHSTVCRIAIVLLEHRRLDRIPAVVQRATSLCAVANRVQAHRERTLRMEVVCKESHDRSVRMESSCYAPQRHLPGTRQHYKALST